MIVENIEKYLYCVLGVPIDKVWVAIIKCDYYVIGIRNQLLSMGMGEALYTGDG